MHKFLVGIISKLIWSARIRALCDHSDGRKRWRGQHQDFGLSGHLRWTSGITKPLTLTGAASGNMGAAVVVPPPTGLIVPPGGFTITASQIFVHDTAGPVIVSNLTVDGGNSQIASCGRIGLSRSLYADLPRK
jgi:hypothetical protein